MTQLPQLTQPRLLSEEDLRRALMEIIDRLNQVIEELNRRETEGT